MSAQPLVSAPHRMLVEGDHLDQPTFHALYEATPPGTRAELIGGVVSMPSPVGISHSEFHVPALVWVAYYKENTPGTKVHDKATTILGWKSEAQPDVILRVLEESGGRTSDDGRYIHGAPELVVEVAKSSRFVDLGPKLNEYDRHGVLEYVVRAIEPDEVVWFRQEQGALVKTLPDADGLYRSKHLPGFWLDPKALINDDTRRLRAVLDLGLASPEHTEFVARLAAEKAKHSGTSTTP